MNAYDLDLNTGTAYDIYLCYMRMEDIYESQLEC